MVKTLALASAALALTIASPADATNLVTNGSFEKGIYNNLDGDPRPQIMLLTPGMPNLHGWIVDGPLGVHWIDEGPTNASDGSRYLDLQGRNPPGQLSRIHTTFETLVGARYLLEFDSFRGNTANTATVSAGSLMEQPFAGPIAPGGPYGPYFERVAFEFTATDAITVLTFRVAGSNGFGPAVDDVQVSVVPEPSSLVIFCLGLAGLAARLRR